MAIGIQPKDISAVHSIAVAPVDFLDQPGKTQSPCKQPMALHEPAIRAMTKATEAMTLFVGLANGFSAPKAFRR